MIYVMLGLLLMLQAWLLCVVLPAIQSQHLRIMGLLARVSRTNRAEIDRGEFRFWQDRYRMLDELIDGPVTDVLWPLKFDKKANRVESELNLAALARLEGEK